MVRNIGKVGEQVEFVGVVSRVKHFNNRIGHGINICVNDVKIQKDGRIVGREDHIWINNYSNRGNQKVNDIGHVKVGQKVGVRGQVRSYRRIDGSEDFDIKNIRVCNII